MSSGETAFDSLLQKIYDGVMEPTGFQRFVQCFVEVFELKAAMMLTANLETGESKGIWVAGMGPEWIEQYAINFVGEDMLAQHMSSAPVAHFYATNLDLNAHEFIDSRFYREWVVPQNIAYASGAIVLKEGPWCSQIVLQRRPDQPPFSREQLEQCNRLIPHLQRAIQMRQRFGELQLGEASIGAGLDVIAMPSLLVDEFGKVGYANGAARDMLEAAQCLRLDDGHLRTNRHELTRRLNVEIMAAVCASRGDITQAPGMVLLPRPGLRPLILMVSPLRLSGASEIKGGAIVFIYDAQTTPTITADLVQRLFDLSEAEAELAVALCAGRTLDEAATARGTSLHTVRSQLKSLFAKTGTNRQADLIVLMLSSPAYFMSTKEISTR